MIIITTISLVVALFSLLVYKYATDQKKLKRLRDEQKELQKEMKQNRNKPDKMMKLQKRSMQIMNEMMPQTMKSMMITFIPIVLIFSWMGSHIAYEPLMPDELFTATMTFEKDIPGFATLEVSEGLELLSDAEQEIVDKTITWELKGDAGTYDLFFNYGEEDFALQALITEERDYLQSSFERQRKFLLLFPMGDGISEDSNVYSVSVDLAKVRPFGENFSVFGIKPNWLGTYIIFSLVFNMILRKLLNVH